MFIFNTDLILHNVFSWPQGILIFIMTCLGNFAFASATQGWFVVKTRFYEIIILLVITFALMRPDAIASLFGVPHEQRYWMYLIGLAIYGVVYLLQRQRIPKAAVPA